MADPTTPDQKRSAVLVYFNAHELASHPYHNRLWKVNGDVIEDQASKLKRTVRTFYVPRYIAIEDVAKLITHVPYVCIASLSKVYGIGGYRSSDFVPLPIDRTFECIVVSGVGPQFEAEYLDFSDFISTRLGMPHRLEAFEHFGPAPAQTKEEWDAAHQNKSFLDFGASGLLLHVQGLCVSLRECLYLWLKAFDEMVALFGNRKMGYFKLTAIGTGFFSDVASTGRNIGSKIMPLIIRSTERVLERHSFKNIAAIEFPDFSGCGLYSPNVPSINNITLVTAPGKDVLDFPDEVKSSYAVGVLNPGDCFSFVGNELGYSSVESMIGNNTTIRSTQCYIWNEAILDENNWVQVPLPESLNADT